MGEAFLDAALDLLQRLPPQQVTRNVTHIAHLQPHLLDDLTSAIDQPLQTTRDPCTGRQYVTSEYNRHEDGYFRSPWCNKFHPPIPAASGASRPRDWLRRLEEDCNDAFSRYLSMYYDGGVSSVYFWSLSDDDDVTGDVDPTHFAAAIFFKKTGATSGGGRRSWRVASTQGSWDSIHVVEIEQRNKHSQPNINSSRKTNATKSKGAAAADDVTQENHYTMTSSIMLWLETNKHVSGLMNIGGSLTKQSVRTTVVPTTTTTSTTTTITKKRADSFRLLKRKTVTKDSAHRGSEKDVMTSAQMTSHLVTLGEMVEEAENQLRKRLEEIYFWRTKDIVMRHLRCENTVAGAHHARRQSRMLDVSELRQVREEAQIRRSPSGKHLVVQAGPSMRV